MADLYKRADMTNTFELAIAAFRATSVAYYRRLCHYSSIDYYADSTMPSSDMIRLLFKSPTILFRQACRELRVQPAKFTAKRHASSHDGTVH